MRRSLGGKQRRARLQRLEPSSQVASRQHALHRNAVGLGQFGVGTGVTVIHDRVAVGPHRL